MSAVGFQSDSYQLVETCLARLRVDAQLDDDPVLPSIDVLPDSDIIEVDTSDVVIVCDSVKELPSAASIVRASVKANQRASEDANEHANANANERSQKQAPTLRRMKAAAEVVATRAPRRPARWPVVLCALVATYFGTTAFIKSPLGAKPEVQHVVKVSRGHIASAIQTTRSLVRL